jgi:hypothetical protein
MTTTTMPDPESVGSTLVRFGTTCVRAYIDSLPADDPERVAYEAAIAGLSGAA